MTSKAKIVLGVFLGLVVAGVVIFYVIPGTVEQIAFSEQKKTFDKSAEGIANPMVGADGKAISRSDPCAFQTTSQGLTDCKSRQTTANYKNAQIQAKNQERYMSIPQHENPLVTPADNYRIYSAETHAEKYLSQIECERLQKQVDWEIPDDYKDNESFMIIMVEVKQIYNSALIQCYDKIAEKGYDSTIPTMTAKQFSQKMGELNIDQSRLSGIGMKSYCGAMIEGYLKMDEYRQYQIIDVPSDIQHDNIDAMEEKFHLKDNKYCGGQK